ncbi:MAG: DUF5694 domain-containing protein [Planctomycetota bacterium]
MNLRLPRPSRWLGLVLLLGVALVRAPAAVAQEPQSAPEKLWRDDPAAVIDHYLAQAKLKPIEVVLVGTFHFDDQGLDEYKPTHHFDALADDRQQQIVRVVDDLAGWKPDLVCVERRPSGQGRVDADYATFRDGGLRDRKNEVVQIGYRLADRLGHQRVHAIDAGGAWLQPRVDPIAWAKKNGRIRQLMTPLQAVGAASRADEDRFIDREDLSTIYRFMNHPRVHQVAHAVYLIGAFHAADGEQFPGPDGFVTHWHNRNLRIFANLRRVAKPGQKVVVLFGNGHMPILRHCIASSPEFRLTELRDVVGKTR